MWQLVKKVIISLIFGLILLNSQTNCLDWKFAVTTSTDIRFFYPNWTYTNHRVRNDNHLRGVAVFAYDGIDDTLYYANNNESTKQGQIYELKNFDYEGHPPPKLVIALNTIITGIVFDSLDDNLYWTDGYKIMQHNVLNNKTELFLESEKIFPTDIALDICERQLYYINQHNTTSIEQINLDSRVINVIVKGLSTTHSITVDYYSQKLYWLDNMDTTNVRIEEANLNGTERQELYKQSSMTPLHLTTDMDNIYYSSATYQKVIRVGKKDRMKTIIDYDFDGATPVDILMKHTAFEFEHSQCKNVIDKMAKKLNKTEELGKPLPKCKNNGIPNAETGKCLCQSIYIQGDFCETDLCHNFCLNDGICSMNIDHSMKCDCPAKFSGNRCETDKCYKFCMNDGVCSINNNGDPICACDKNKYSGERCEENITINLCKDHCFNAGTCSVINDTAVCNCSSSYAGDRCEVNKCHSYCLHNGKCVVEAGEPMCTCKSPYKGSRCEIVESPNTQNYDNYCLNGGILQFKNKLPTCKCPKLVSGAQCEETLCKNYCLNDGICDLVDGKPVCQCSKGVKGDRCQVEFNFSEIYQKSCNGDYAMASLYEIDINSDVCLNFTSDIKKLIFDFNDNNVITTESDYNKMECSCMSSSIFVVTFGVVLSLVLMLIIVVILRKVYKPLRPKVKKTYVVRKNFTPLTSRPGGGTTEQCEITIEDCCNMNICETPCFDPKMLQGCDSSNESPISKKSEKKRKEDKRKLLDVDFSNGGELF